MRATARLSTWSALVVAALWAAVALRAWVLSSPLGALDADEAIVGLMALHALDGEFSVFYWNALYGGSQEALLTAAVFALTGASTLALKLVSLLVFAAAGVFVWLVGRRTVEEPAARIGVALFAIWPAYFVWWTTKSRGYFGLGLLLGLASLWLALRLRERLSRADAAALGFVLGFGLWATLQAMLIALPALAWLVWRRPASLRLFPYALPGLVVGAAPWLAWNLRHDWNAVVPTSVAGGGTTYLERLTDFFTIVLPTWLGVRAPYSHEWLLGRAIGVLVVGVALAAFVWLLVRRPPGLEPLLVVGTAFPFLYAASTHTFYVEEPRYLTFLSPVPALLLGKALTRAGAAAAAAGLTAALALSIAGLAKMERDELTAPRLLGYPVPADLDPVLDLLERERVRYVLASYWIAYRITFESDERIVATSTGFVRYPPHDRLVRASPSPARVFISGSVGERLARPTLLARGERRREVDGFAVYLPR